jgi:hypothetical protein
MPIGAEPSADFTLHRPSASFWFPQPRRVSLITFFPNVGTAEVGASYFHTRRTIFPGVGAAPSTDENVVMFSFRYFPFQ